MGGKEKLLNLKLQIFEHLEQTSSKLHFGQAPTDQ